MSEIEKLGDATLEVMSPVEVKQALDANEIVLIDVRTPAEFVFEHIPGALLFPLSYFDAQKLPDQVQKRIVFHCGSGKRSHMVSERCAAAGIKQLAHMAGGLGAWKEAGLPYCTVDPSTGNTIMKP